DHRMDAGGFGRSIKLHGAEQIAMIGHADGRHVLRGHDFHQLIDLAGAVEKGIIGVIVKVYERSFGHRKGARGVAARAGETSILAKEIRATTGSRNGRKPATKEKAGPPAA